MNKNTLKLIIVSAILIVLIAIGTISAFVDSLEKIPLQNKVASEENNIPVAEADDKSKNTDNQDELPDYETIYLDYIKNNTEYFSRGMMLCDLNDDDIPELFSIAYDEEGDLVYYHELKDNTVITPSDGSVKTYIDIDNLVRPTTFFEDTGHFIGIYKNKSTGQKALINSIADGSENDRFDIITYNGESFVLKDEGVKSAINNSWPINKKRDSVMSDYALANDELYTSFLLRGEFGGEYGNDPVESLKGLIEDFKKSETSIKYDKTTDGEFFCCIRNINLSDNEIELIPVASITYEEYNDAINADKMFTLNEETMSIQLDDFLYSEYGIAHLYQMPSFEYQFYVPTEEYPTSVIEGYIGNTPVKVKMSNDLKIRYGVSGAYNTDGTPNDYETLGRNKEYTMSEYLPHFAEYSMNSYYKAIIKNNKLVFLDVMYDEWYKYVHKK